MLRIFPVVNRQLFLIAIFAKGSACVYGEYFPRSFALWVFKLRFGKEFHKDESINSDACVYQSR